MVDFPIEKVVFRKATLKGESGNASIEIDIAPFDLSLDDYSENIETVIRLNGIDIPIHPKEIEGKHFTFPINPTHGYIDGSIYFFAAHNPIDVTDIQFEVISSGKLAMSLETKWLLDYERAGYKNLNKRVEVSIEL